MTHRPISFRTTVRCLGSFAAAASFALLAAGAGCVVGEEGADDDSIASVPEEVDCSGFSEWAQRTVYRFGDVVTDTGDAFAATVSHTSFAPDWNPKRAASLWFAVGQCAGGGGGGEPPPPPPGGGGDDEEVDEPAPPPPPPPPPAEGCLANGRPGPLFDPAGVPNVGNGEGEQFIGGQCLDASDCASGCCALPCGICSGPGAQFQNGKQGCGFVD